MEKVAILGAGGFAREVLDIFMAINATRKEQQYDVVGFIDENPAIKGTILNGVHVLGDFSWFDSIDRGKVRVVCGIGSPHVRRKVVDKAFQHNLEFINVIHPTALLTPYISIGTGVVITAGCIITNRIKIGNHVHVNLGCTIGHDDIIDDFCTLAPGIHVSGNVHIKEGVDIGTGSVTVQGITIGEWSIIGAGSVITKSLPPNVTAVGVPAQVIKTREIGWHEK